MKPYSLHFVTTYTVSQETLDRYVNDLNSLRARYGLRNAIPERELDKLGRDHGVRRKKVILEKGGLLLTPRNNQPGNRVASPVPYGRDIYALIEPSNA